MLISLWDIFNIQKYPVNAITLQAFIRGVTKLWNTMNYWAVPFEFKSIEDVLKELEVLKVENQRLHDEIDTNITALWEAVHQVRCPISSQYNNQFRRRV